MTDIVTHAFVSGKADGGDPTKVNASNWDEGHIFAGGVSGQHLARDTSAAKGARWTDPAILNVLDYGAVCDGSTDDTAAIQATLNKAALIGTSIDTVAGAVTVLIPGRTKITSGLTLAVGTCLIGNGQWTSQLDASSLTSGPIFSVTAASNGRIFGVQLRAMKVTGPGRTSTIDGLSITSGAPQDIILEDVWFTAVRDAIVFVTCEKIRLERVRVSESRRGLYVSGSVVSTTLSARACHFDQNEQGAYLERCDGFYFAQNIFETNNRSTSLPDGNVAVVLRGVANTGFCLNHFESNTLDVLSDILTTGHSIQTQFVVFDQDVFNPPSDLHTAIVLVDAVQVSFRNIRVAASSTVYMQIYDAVSGTVDIVSADTGGQGGTLAFKNQSGSVVAYPPGTNSIQILTYLSAWNILNGSLKVSHPNANFPALRAQVVGEAQPRLDIDVSGKHHWGDGANAQDTLLYRGAAGRLQTDTDLRVTGALDAGSNYVQFRKASALISSRNSGDSADIRVLDCGFTGTDLITLGDPSFHLLVRGDRIGIGGLTASGVALKQVGTTLKIMLGDGSTVVGASIDTGAYKANGVAGVSGSFTTADGKTVTVTGGLITAIV